MICEKPQGVCGFSQIPFTGLQKLVNVDEFPTSFFSNVSRKFVDEIFLEVRRKLETSTRVILRPTYLMLSQKIMSIQMLANSCTTFQ